MESVVNNPVAIRLLITRIGLPRGVGPGPRLTVRDVAKIRLQQRQCTPKARLDTVLEHWFVAEW